jgi:DNA invertase Pin-like site-specific DNA recombinase
MRAVVYARYSSDLQREASIDDQIEVCRRYAEAQGWTIVGTYRDAAISGASRFRPGFQKLIADSAGHRFDIVICEAIDRLGRRLADTADLQDQLGFQAIRLYTPSLGEITHMHVAVMGMMAPARAPRRSPATSIAKASRGQAAGCGRTPRSAARSTARPGS